MRRWEGGGVCAGQGESPERDGEGIRAEKSQREYYEKVVGGGEMGAGMSGEMDNLRNEDLGGGVRHNNGREARV